MKDSSLFPVLKTAFQSEIFQSATVMKDQTLTTREIDILKDLALGRSNAQISQSLGISVNTVKTHLKHIFKKLQVDNRPAAASTYFQMSHLND